jgi:cellulose synthase/poly-beta-1,6-N-acetylglucosamine synthase-like glycosyltransferase
VSSDAWPGPAGGDGSPVPRVSIGMPVYNGERYMAETIDSILGQTFGDIELIVSDNASTDATGDIAQRYAAEDSRVRYIRNPRNVGAARNYSQLLAFARGEYFKWAGYDDLLLPPYVERCVAALDADPGLVIAYPRTDIIDGNGKVVREHDDNLHLDSPDPVERVRAFAWRFTLCNPCFGVQRREALDRTSLIQPFVSSDVPQLVEMAILGRWHEVPERLFQRRIHDTSSRQGNVTMAQVAQWFDPGRSRPLAPRNRMVAECVRSIMRSGLDPATKSRAVGAFLQAWTLRRARVRGGQAKAALNARRDRERRGVEVSA